MCIISTKITCADSINPFPAEYKCNQAVELTGKHKWIAFNCLITFINEFTDCMENMVNPHQLASLPADLDPYCFVFFKNGISLFSRKRVWFIHLLNQDFIHFGRQH